MKPDFLLQRIADRPLMEPVDAVKLIYQNEFGCGHLLPDESACAAFVRDEIASTQASDTEPVCEPIGNGLCRLNLRNPQVRALQPERLARMMRVTAAHVQGSRARYLDTLQLLRTLLSASNGTPNPTGFPFTAAMLGKCLSEVSADSEFIPSHSARYRAAYQPAYRVVLRRYADALPVLTAVESKLTSNGRATLVLDGDCASGKTTLLALMAPLYPCNTFHMDDFFLPLSMRTPQRMAEPGGNIHYERFCSQVLAGLTAGHAFTYVAFDCHTDTGTEVTVNPAPVTLVEGSYALHPAFDKAYAKLDAVRVLLTVTPEEQLRRILLRNGEAMIERFRKEWIPLEKRYFQAYHVARGDEMTLPSPRHIEDETPKGDSLP